MKAETKDFLLSEYDEVWKHNTYVVDTRNKAIALYFTITGAIAAAGLSLFDKQLRCQIPPWIGNAWVDQLVCLPRYFAVPSLLFLIITTVVTLLILIRPHRLSAEYMTVLNRIRAAFLEDDREFLQRFLVLPTEQNMARRFKINFWIIGAVSVVGALVIAFSVAYVLNWPLAQRVTGHHPAWRAAPPLIALVWLVVWVALYNMQTAWTDREVKKRLRLEKVAKQGS